MSSDRAAVAPPVEAPAAGAALSVRQLGKMYPLYERPHDRLRQVLSRGRRTLYREFWALRDVSFELGSGEILGVIGRNGSGKSTLLQLVAGVLQPSVGHVHVPGRVAALLELGSGFHPEFTGRENVLLAGAIVGLSRREMQRRFDEIAGFADIGEFVDQPVKTYSSGMFVRLAFAVQVGLVPDVLIVDEVLAVGDAGFQRKCYRRIEELRAGGCAILFVTHDLNALTNLCRRALLLEGGTVIMEGSPSELGNEYQKRLFGHAADGAAYEYGDGGAVVLDAAFEDPEGRPVRSVATHSTLCYWYRIRFLRGVDAPVFGVTVRSIQGIVLCSTNTQMLGARAQRYASGSEVMVRWRLRLPLAPGQYFFSCGCSYPDADRFLCRRVDAMQLAVVGPVRQTGLTDLVEQVSVEPRS